jgi:hypothetical protein
MPTFSWKRGLKHAALPVLALVIASGAYATTSHRIDAYKLGEATGKAAVGVLAIVMAISYLAQTGRTTAAWGLGIGLPVALSVGVIVALGVSGPSAPPVRPLTAADRAPLERTTIAGEPRLHHPSLGFSVRDPGPDFKDIAGQARSNDDTRRIYVYTDLKSGDTLQIGISAITVFDEHAFREFTDGIVAGLRQSASAAGKSFAETRHDVTCADGRCNAQLAATIDTTHVHLAAYTIARPDGAPLALAIIGIGESPTALADVVASYKP